MINLFMRHIYDSAHLRTPGGTAFCDGQPLDRAVAVTDKQVLVYLDDRRCLSCESAAHRWAARTQISEVTR